MLEQKETEVIDELENNQENIIEELLETNKEERIEKVEEISNNQKKDNHRNIREKLPEKNKPVPDDPLTMEYQEIQEKMKEQANIRSILLETQEEIKKAIAEATQHNDTSRLDIFKDITRKLTDLSQQFEYGKLSSEKVKNEIIVIKNQIKELSKKRYIINQEISSQNPIESIKKFKELLDIGVITEEEFEQKKKDLLNQI